MIIDEKKQILEKLVGIQSSKKNYYVKLKESLHEVTKRNTQLEIISQLLKSITVNMSFDDIMAEVVGKLKQVIDFDRIALFTFENSHLVMTHVFPNYLTKLQIGEPIPHDHSLYWSAIRNKKYVTSYPHSEMGYYENEILAPLGISTVIVFPLLIQNEVIGLISIGSKKNIVYSDPDISFLNQVADHLAVCFDNFKLFHTVLQIKDDMEGTFQAVTDLLLQINTDYSIPRYNDAVPSFFSIQDEELRTKKCYELICNRNSPCEPCVMNEVRQTRKSISKQINTSDGRTLDVYIYPKFNQNKELVGIIQYAKDISKRLQMEAQLIQSAKLAAIGEMAAGVAHELNNPLTAILGNAQLLMKEFTKGSIQENLMKDIHHCGVRCKKIIENLLTFSRQDSYFYEKLNMNELVEKALKLVGYQIDKSKIEIEKHVSQDVSLVIGSKQHLEQIIINILLNAKDALEGVIDGKITICTGVTKQVPYKLTKNNKHRQFAYISIEDNGCGIPSEHLTEIFNPFFTTKEATKGTGLGLSVCLGIAEAHSGTISAESEIGQGSTFTLYLPTDESE